jgi:hypothetical protein
MIRRGKAGQYSGCTIVLLKSSIGPINFTNTYYHRAGQYLQVLFGAGIPCVLTETRNG